MPTNVIPVNHTLFIVRVHVNRPVKRGLIGVVLIGIEATETKRLIPEFVHIFASLPVLNMNSALNYFTYSFLRASRLNPSGIGYRQIANDHTVVGLASITLFTSEDRHLIKSPLALVVDTDGP